MKYLNWYGEYLLFDGCWSDALWGFYEGKASNSFVGKFYPPSINMNLLSILYKGEE